MLYFTCGERKICSTIKKSQNIMNMIVGSMQMSLFANIATEVSKMSNLIYLFFCFELSETANSSGKIYLVIDTKDANFTKARFCLRATNSHCLFLYKLCCFQNRNLWQTFQRLFLRKWGLPQFYLLNETESLQYWVLNDMRQMATFFVLDVQFF